MWTINSSYKDDFLFVQASPSPSPSSLLHPPPPPLSSPITVHRHDCHHHYLHHHHHRNSTQHLHPSARVHSLPPPFPTPSQPSSGGPTPSGLKTTISLQRSGSGRHGLYDWSPIPLLTPPPSSQGTKRTSSSSPTKSDQRDLSARNRSPFTGHHHQFDRNAVWPESPTLATRRAKKHPQLGPALESLRTSAKQTLFDNTARQQIMSSSAPSQSSQSRHQVDAKPLQTLSRSRALTGGSHNMLPPFKPRALTLDGADRPTLPPMLDYVSPSQVGPIRKLSHSSLRHAAEHRSNPYFISTPARRSISHARSSASFSPQTSREASDAETWSPYHAPWTPTSSVRSTSSGIYHEDVIASSYTLSRTPLTTPLHLDSSPLGPRHIVPSPTKKDDGSGTFTGSSLATQLPSSHLPLPNNALGIYMEPSPFPNELLHLDLSPAAHRGLTPRSEPDFFLSSSGGSSKFENQQGRTAPHLLTRSPAPMSDLSSQTPSPASYSDDSLPKLSLGRHHGLNAQSIDQNLALPALQQDDPPHRHPVSTLNRKPASKDEVDDFLYKMPILRGMSPLADMSSDSEDDDADEPLASSSMCLSGPPSIVSGKNTTIKGEAKQQQQQSLPAEGSTGEIFLKSKSVLPLTLKESRVGATFKKLFCKLDSTTHQCFSVVDGKWACYRRNYLKVDVSFHFEDEHGRRRDTISGDFVCSPPDRRPFPVERIAVHMTAHIINDDGKLQKGRQGLVPLIQFGPARERGPREALQPVELRVGGSVGKDASANEQAATRSGNVAAFRRVQIRSATMNNGQRGSAGQQFYALKLTLLAYPRQAPLTASAGVELASVVSHPITVRGRSKVHYAAPGGSGKPKANAREPNAGHSTTKKSAAMSSSRSTMKRRNSSSGGVMDGEYRRSTRLLLAASQESGGGGFSENMVEDADDECEEGDVDSASRASKVMDIRSVI
ncbi:uncharacterized protein UTRI_03100_B [Ustilago trichophora]|uniref:NDT80 domain-containing protein n=1 Tax=Ustilago trichophora TaxID=86804 RepID=A0A5C3E5X7_9BASI|nr:uncharacterized protein UTRI_03100_B [Ustilago trichophora]